MGIKTSIHSCIDPLHIVAMDRLEAHEKERTLLRSLTKDPS